MTSRSKEYTRRQFMMYQVLMEGVPAAMAQEAVSTTLLEHPELDPDETMTWAEWDEVMV